MRLVEEKIKNEKCNTHYADPFAWICRNNGQWYINRKIAKPDCRKKLSTRQGTWMASPNTLMPKILQVVYHKCEGLTLSKIKKQASVCGGTVAKITKIVRLLAENFMLQNPTLNKIGGLDSEGNPIVCQINET